MGKNAKIKALNTPTSVDDVENQDGEDDVENRDGEDGQFLPKVAVRKFPNAMCMTSAVISVVLALLLGLLVFKLPAPVKSGPEMQSKYEVQDEGKKPTLTLEMTEWRSKLQDLSLRLGGPGHKIKDSMLPPVKVAEGRRLPAAIGTLIGLKRWYNKPQSRYINQEGFKAGHYPDYHGNLTQLSYLQCAVDAENIVNTATNIAFAAEAIFEICYPKQDGFDSEMCASNVAMLIAQIAWLISYAATLPAFCGLADFPQANCIADSTLLPAAMLQMAADAMAMGQSHHHLGDCDPEENFSQTFEVPVIPVGLSGNKAELLQKHPFLKFVNKKRARFGIHGSRGGGRRLSRSEAKEARKNWKSQPNAHILEKQANNVARQIIEDVRGGNTARQLNTRGASTSRRQLSTHVLPPSPLQMQDALWAGTDHMKRIKQMYANGYDLAMDSSGSHLHWEYVGADADGDGVPDGPNGDGQDDDDGDGVPDFGPNGGGELGDQAPGSRRRGIGPCWDDPDYCYNKAMCYFAAENNAMTIVSAAADIWATHNDCFDLVFQGISQDLQEACSADTWSVFNDFLSIASNSATMAATCPDDDDVPIYAACVADWTDVATQMTNFAIFGSSVKADCIEND